MTTLLTATNARPSTPLRATKRLLPGALLFAALAITAEETLAAAASGRVFDTRVAWPSSVRLTRAPYVQWTTTTSAHLVWNTREPSGSIVEYESASGTKAGVRNVVKTMLVTRHIVRLDGLKPATRYRYRIGAGKRVLASGTFETAKTSSQAFSFVVWGDSGTGSRGQKTLASRIQAQRPDFLLHSGDLVYPRGSVADFDPKFFSLYKPTVARVPFYGALGNHDIGTRNGQPFLDNFVFPRNGPRGVQPERHFSFDYGNAHIVVIDSNASERQLREVVAPWIRADAAKTKALWKFAVFHHPPFSSGLHGDEPRTLRALVPTFARLKFDIVFNGHDHHFERFAPKSGVRYVVTGAGGAPLYPRRDQNPKTHAFRNDVYSLTRIDISGRTLRGRQISSDGAILDDWKITK